MEFWNDQATDRSWKALIQLAKTYHFVLIGGWACYLYTKTIKSKDIDIIVEYDMLFYMKSTLSLKKNEILKKYETIVDGISVDIYVPFYSELVLPLKLIQNHTVKTEGLVIPKPEILLVLKQQAEMARKDSVKGQKDRVDILNILIKADIDFKAYYAIIKEYNLHDYGRRLYTIIKRAKSEFEYLKMENVREIKLIKEDLIERLDFARNTIFRP
jgi:hypothetical protein